MKSKPKSSHCRSTGASRSNPSISVIVLDFHCRKDFAPMDPKELRFTPSHEWVHLDGEVATVGISRFAVDQLTDLIMIDLPAVGSKLTAGKSFGEVESVKAVSDLYSPVSGEVVEVNGDVAGNVQLLAEDPFGKGWLVKVRVSDPSAVAGLLDHGAYERKIAEEAH
jgi:glycine cleavage system H protein